jgi:hypothetical protein
MLTQGTAAKIYNCYSEIKSSEYLLGEMNKKEEALNALKQEIDKEDFLKETSYYNNGLIQMTIPCSENSGSVYRIEFGLGRSALIAHIAKQKALLVSLNEQARLELDTEGTDAAETA